RLKDLASEEKCLMIEVLERSLELYQNQRVKDAVPPIEVPPTRKGKRPLEEEEIEQPNPNLKKKQTKYEPEIKKDCKKLATHKISEGAKKGSYCFSHYKVKHNTYCFETFKKYLNNEEDISQIDRTEFYHDFDSSYLSGDYPDNNGKTIKEGFQELRKNHKNKSSEKDKFPNKKKDKPNSNDLCERCHKEERAYAKELEQRLNNQSNLTPEERQQSNYLRNLQRNTLNSAENNYQSRYGTLNEDGSDKGKGLSGGVIALLVVGGIALVKQKDKWSLIIPISGLVTSLFIPYGFKG
ncbi:13242_t:CDS:2, partial [Funneliformis geosporum]